MSTSVLYAVKRAIESARHDIGHDEPFTLCELVYYNYVTVLCCCIAAPSTVEDIQQTCLVDPSKFAF